MGVEGEEMVPPRRTEGNRTMTAYEALSLILQASQVAIGLATLIHLTR